MISGGSDCTPPVEVGPGRGRRAGVLCWKAENVRAGPATLPRKIRDQGLIAHIRFELEPSKSDDLTRVEIIREFSWSEML